MAHITRIGTRGYRGSKTNNAFIPAGEYAVGDDQDLAQHIVSRDLADYMVSIDLAWIVAVDDPAPPSAREAFMHPAAPSSAPAEVVEHDEQPDMDEAVDIPFLWDYEALESLTVDELRTMAGTNGIDLPDGYVKKADLIEMLLTHD
jgi:hypothetical protein